MNGRTRVSRLLRPAVLPGSGEGRGISMLGLDFACLSGSDLGYQPVGQNAEPAPVVCLAAFRSGGPRRAIRHAPMIVERLADGDSEKGQRNCPKGQRDDAE